MRKEKKGKHRVKGKISHRKRIGNQWDEWVESQREGIKEDKERIEKGEPLNRIVGWKEWQRGHP